MLHRFHPRTTPSPRPSDPFKLPPATSNLHRFCSLRTLCALVPTRISHKSSAIKRIRTLAKTTEGVPLKKQTSEEGPRFGLPRSRQDSWCRRCLSRLPRAHAKGATIGSCAVCIPAASTGRGAYFSEPLRSRKSDELSIRQRMRILSEHRESKDLSVVLSPLECALPRPHESVSKQRVSSLLESALTSMAMLYSKQRTLSPAESALTQFRTVSPLESALPKKGGGEGVSPLATRHSPLSSQSGFGGRSALGGVDELADFGALFVEVGEVLFAEALVDLELLLGAVFCAGADVGLA
jgi:hypothetical protein